MSRFDESPVLPDEAEDLGTHVTKCAKRYNALVHLHQLVFRRLDEQDSDRKKMRWENRIMNLTIALPLCYIAWELLKHRL